MTEFACDLFALSPEERERHLAVIQEMHSQIQTVQELPDGYALRFPPHPSLLPLLTEFITRERRCCPFLAFSLAVEPMDGPFWLQLSGPAGVKQFLQAEMNLSRLVETNLHSDE